MTWYYYTVKNINKPLHTVESITVTKAWLKAISSALQTELLTKPECFLDAITETVVSYPTVHQIKHFEAHYKQAYDFFNNHKFELDENRDIYVMWIPGQYGYTTCSFIFPICSESFDFVIISPHELPMINSWIQPN